MDPVIVAGILTAIANVVSTALTNESNADLMSQQQDYNERMMDKQNEYNSPANQVKRMKAAGINPISSSMSSGSVTGGQSAGSLPMTLLPNVDPVSAALSGTQSALSAFAQGQSGYSDMSSRDLRLEQIRLQNEELIATTKGLNLSAESQEIVNQFVAARETWALEGQKATVYKTYAERAKANQEFKNMRYELENVLPEQVKKIIAERNVDVLNLDVLVATVKDLEASTALKGEQAATEAIRQGLTQSEADLAEQESDYYPKLISKIIDKYGEEIRNIAASTGKTNEETYWYAYDIISKHESSFGGVKVSDFVKRHRTTSQIFDMYKNGQRQYPTQR